MKQGSITDYNKLTDGVNSCQERDQFDKANSSQQQEDL